MRLRCLLASQFITAAALGERPLPVPVASHRDHCLRCQAYSSSLRSTRRRLASLGAQPEVPPPDLGDAVVYSLDRRPEADRRWLPAAGVALAVGAAAAWAWRRQQVRA
jgi:hypothetical protein